MIVGPVLLSSCYTQVGPSIDETLPSRRAELIADLPSPCDDSLFVALQGVPLDSLSIREYDYLRTKEQQCFEWRGEQRAQARAEPKGQSAWGVVGIVLTTIIVLGIVL